MASVDDEIKNFHSFVTRVNVKVVLHAVVTTVWGWIYCVFLFLL